MKRIINVADAETNSVENGEYFAHSMTELADALGAVSLGANLTRVPPGKAAFPYHHHHANEEHFFILSGSATLRDGDELHEVKAHDYIVHLPGGPETAHQLVNTGTEDLVYLAISTTVLPEVVGLPDARKTSVRTSYSPENSSRFLVTDDAKDSAAYWEGEDGKQVAAVLENHQPG